MQIWENRRVDLMERSLDSFHLANTQNICLSQEVVVVLLEHLFQRPSLVCFSKVLS